MSTSSKSESPVNDPLSQACWLVSCELDEMLTVDEKQELRRLEELHPREVQAFRDQCQQLRAVLISLPVKPVKTSLFVAPASSVATPAAASEALPLVPRKTRSGAQRLVVGIVTSVLCGVLVLAFNRPQQSDSFDSAMVRMSAPSEADRWGLGRELSLGTSAESIPEIPTARMNATPPAASAMDATVAADVPASALSDRESSDREDAVDESSIAPLIQSDNWNVVVVKVEGQDRDMAMDRIQAIVQEHGLRLQKSAGTDQPEWLGVVLTSAVEQSSDVVTAMERDLGEPASRSVESKSVESKADASRSSQIIAAVRESLRFPTRSELHHGRIFVALPTQQEVRLAVPGESADSADPVAEINPRVTGHSAADAVVAPDETESVQPNAVAAKKATKAVVADAGEARPASAVVTLVVFEFH